MPTKDRKHVAVMGSAFVLMLIVGAYALHSLARFYFFSFGASAFTPNDQEALRYWGGLAHYWLDRLLASIGALAILATVWIGTWLAKSAHDRRSKIR